MEIKNFKDLIVWQKAMKLATEVYRITNKLPKEESYGLTSQMRRSAVSVPSNISEGHSRHSTKEFQRFLYIALGSNSELETQLLLCIELAYLKNEDLKQIFELHKEVEKMIKVLARKLN